jgi:hypothetical protein
MTTKTTAPLDSVLRGNDGRKLVRVSIITSNLAFRPTQPLNFS